MLAAIAVAALTAISVEYVDRPLALWLAEFHFFQAQWTRSTFHAPVMIAGACLAALGGIPFLTGRKRIPTLVEAGMLAGWAVMASVCLVELCLKPVFDRTLPTIFLATGHYSFNWLHGRIGDSAFPSGHSAQAAAILSVLWVYYPRWRMLCGAAMAVLAFTLIAGEWHFLGDVIAGTFIGAALGATTIWFWRTVIRRPSGEQRPK